MTQLNPDSLTGRTKDVEPHWRIPRLSIARYDRQGYEGFLERMGMSQDDLLRDLTQDSQRVLGCYQEWLLFGTLHEFEFLCPDVFSIGRITNIVEGDTEYISFDIVVNLLRDFCEEYLKGKNVQECAFDQDPDQDMLDRITWLVVLQAFQGSAAQEKLAQHGQHLASTLTQAKTAARVLHKHITKERRIASDSIWRNFRQLLVLLEILLETLETIDQLLSGKPEALSNLRSSFGLNVTYIREEMMRNGWCPSRVDGILNQGYGSCAFNYLLSLQPSFDSRDHSMCKETACELMIKNSQTAVMKVSPSQMNSSHLSTDFMPPSEKILAAGSFPLIKRRARGLMKGLRQLSSTYEPFKLVKYTSGSKFLAISHIWAHGLGNPTVSSLPISELNRLQDYTKELGQTCFWIDTICVPAKGPGKLQGIAKLREVYSKATIVLIIDGRLSKIKPRSITEAKMQFLCSEWFSRLWTLQEGWLASDLRVQFFGVALSTHRLFTTLDWPSVYPGRLGLNHLLLEQLGGYLNRAGSFNLISLQRALRNRHVTKHDDEPICIATLLNLDFADFEGGKPTMEQIYGRVKLLQALLWAEAPRLTKKGFQLAPSTLLNQWSNELDFRYPESADILRRCKLTPDGLRTKQVCVDIQRDLDFGPYGNHYPGTDSSHPQGLWILVLDAEDNSVIMVLRTSSSLLHQCGRLPTRIERPSLLMNLRSHNDGTFTTLGQTILVQDVTKIEGIRHGHYVTCLRETDIDTMETQFEEGADLRVQVWGKQRMPAEWCID